MPPLARTNPTNSTLGAPATNLRTQSSALGVSGTVGAIAAASSRASAENASAELPQQETYKLVLDEFVTKAGVEPREK